MKNRDYAASVHFYGIIWDITALLLFILVPVAICVHLGVWPQGSYVLKGLLPVAMLFYPTSVIEVFTYTPLLGAGGTYLSFVTGNITNLKLPCGLNAMENAGVRANSEEGEVISTIAIATSSIVTTIIIAVGVVAFSPVLPYLTDENSIFAPAFNQVVPALFGALGISYFMKHWKIAIVPVAAIILILLVNGEIASGVLIPVGVVISLVSAHLMFKKGLLDDKTEKAEKSEKAE